MRIAGWMVVLGTPLFLIGSALLAIPLFPSRLGPRSGSFGLETLAMLVGGGGLAIVGLLLGVLGLALYVLIPSLSDPPRAARDYGSHRVVAACTILSIVLGNLLAILYFLPASQILSGSGPRSMAGQMLSPHGLVAAALSLDAALFGIVYLRVVRPGAITWKRMGLERTGLARRLLIGILFGIVLLVASSILEMLLQRLGIQQTQTELFASVRGASLVEFLLVMLAGTVVAPIVEEIYFRGYVFTAYRDQKGLGRAFLFSAGLFALVHLNLAAFLPILAMGLLLSFFYYRTNSIIPGIVAHAFNNTLAFLLLYLGLQ